ncbi:MAG: hypothetical protein Q9168_004266 [Polycauliona sp. 1 TL-2023]
MSFTGPGSDHAREALVRANGRLLESGQGADMTIITKDGAKKYHSAIVCPRSTVLSAAYWSSFKEGITKTIDLSEDEAPSVDRMIRYLYVMDYPDPDNGFVNAELYIKGDQYDIPDLRKLAAARFAQCCHELGQLSKATVDERYKSLFDLVLQLVDIAYDRLPEKDLSLRRPLTQALAKFLHASPTLISYGPYRRTCVEYPQFGLDMQTTGLLAVHAGQPGWT